MLIHGEKDLDPNDPIVELDVHLMVLSPRTNLNKFIDSNLTFVL